MFGIDDPAVWLAFILCLATTAVCIGYGIRNWNSGDDKFSSRDKAWARQKRRWKMNCKYLKSRAGLTMELYDS